MPKVFLSYAAQDRWSARQIAARIRAHGFTVFDYAAEEQPGAEIVTQMEENLRDADAFLAVMSPHFLKSTWCDQERQYALRRQKDLRTTRPGFTFVYVLHVSDTPRADSGFLGNLAWIDLRDGDLAPVDGVLDRLTPVAPREAPTALPRQPPFRNRTDELEQLQTALNSPDGHHFWVVVASPQMGKSWFLQRLRDRMCDQDVGLEWVMDVLEVSAVPESERDQAERLVARMFSHRRIDFGPDMERDLARRIVEGGRPHLGLIDNAELLSAATVKEVRARLSRIHDYVRDASHPAARFALVAASRRQDGWRGLGAGVRMGMLRIAEFGAHIINEALRDATVGRTFGENEHRANAARLHRQIEGLPGLLTESLQWLQDNQFINLATFEEDDAYRGVIQGYIETRLLSEGALLQSSDEKSLPLLRWTYEVLTPYRIITHSHLTHHLSTTPAVGRLLDTMGWSSETLWTHVAQSAPLLQVNEGWEAIEPSIRRLLNPYFRPSDDLRAAAHAEASSFYASFSEELSGKEAAAFFVERLWHEAEQTKINDPRRLSSTLLDSAKKLSDIARRRSALSASEVRRHTAGLLEEDDEFQDAIRHENGLFDALIATVVAA